MRKRFILLVDFSEYSGNLIKYACDWSKRTNAEILLVHQTIVLTPALTDHDSKKYMTEATNAEAMQNLKKLAKELIPLTVEVSYLVSESNLQLTLSKLLTDPFENLIFVGLKGSGLLKKIFIGSVAIQIIENIKNIVVAMPKEIDTFSHETIFVGVTEKHALNIPAFNNFLKFFDKETPNITFFYLSKSDEKTTGIEKQLSDLCGLFADRFNTDFAIYGRDDSFDEIKKIINNKTTELLIIQKGSRLLTDRLFRKFLINELVYEGQTPLIVLP